MANRPDFLARLRRLSEIEAAARPPPTAEQRREAEPVMAEIAALRTMMASTRTMRPARTPPESLPEPIDIAALARQHDLTMAEAVELIQIAEWRGRAFSRIDSETGRLLWYWRDQ